MNAVQESLDISGDSLLFSGAVISSIPRER